ncbi:hypothetical protein M5689_017021 [Euphorbia peplus]|nr:hypothetical protein M5689_017021 [Euphorbia peplus]
MASSSFLLVLLILLHANCLIVQAKEKRPAAQVVAGNGIRLLQVMNKEISGDVSGATMGREVRNERLKGRKMMVKKEEGVKVEERKMSGAGNCEDTIRNQKCKMMSISTRSRNPNLKDKMVDFTAFTADYHLPKPHPPKHN